MKKISFSRNIKVKFDVDVCVAGGGPAGVAAALAASRSGAEVFLAEKIGCFGGMGTAGLVPAFCGMSDGVNFLGGAICREVFESLKIDSESNQKFSLINAETLKRVYDRMIVESGIHYTLETKLVAVEVENGIISSAIFSGASGLFAVNAKVFIDCTGNGDLAAWAGASFTKGNDDGVLIPATVCSSWSGIDWNEFRDQQPNVFQLLMQAIEENVFSIQDRHHTGMFPTGKSYGTANMGHIFNLDATDFRSLTEGWIDMRRRLPEYQRFYREYVPGFANVELVATAQSMGVRESRRIEGDYILTLADFESRASFTDEIGRFAYAVDIHPLDASPTEFERFSRDFYGRLRYQPGESYGVPYRILTPKGLVNALVAGRCVSTDQPMEASIRVMPGCFLTGQAAGFASALALNCEGNVRNIPLKELKSRMYLA